MFQPKITQRSREICATKESTTSKSVFDRLGEHGDHQRIRKLQLESTKMQQFIRRVAGVGTDDPRHGTYKRKQERTFNQVEYDASTCRFLIDNFQLQLTP